jgi:ketosteroid isomerase-like protein
MKITFAIVFYCLAVCGIASSQIKQTQEREIGRFIQRYDDAWNQKDAANIERILAPEYVYFSSKGEVTCGFFKN